MQKSTDALTLYRHIVLGAWRTAWRHKHLWLFGFFAVFSGFGGVYELLIRAHYQIVEDVPALQWTSSTFYLLPGAATLRAIIDLSPHPALTLILFLFLLALISAVFVWIITVSIGAIVGSVDKIRKGSDPEFGEGVRMGAAKFWPVFGINALAKIVTGVVIIFSGTNLFVLLRDRTIGSGLYYIFAFIVFLAVSVVVCIVAVYASLNSILAGERFWPAIEHGWRQFEEYWLISLEMAALILIVDLVVCFLAALVMMVLAVPAIFLFLLADVAGASGLLVTIATLSAVILLAAIVLYTSFMTTFQIAGWTLLWADLNEKKPRSKLQRLGDWLLPRKN